MASAQISEPRRKISAIVLNSRSPSDLKDLSATVCGVNIGGKGAVMQVPLSKSERWAVHRGFCIHKQFSEFPLNAFIN